MRLTVLAPGTGSSPVVAALVRRALERSDAVRVDVVVGTGDDVSVLGLRLCRTTDAVLDALAGRAGAPRPDGAPGAAASADDGVVQRGLTELGAAPSWLHLRDDEISRHLTRTSWLVQGLTPSDVCQRMGRALGLPAGVTVRPVTDLPVETHVVVPVDDDASPEAAVHVREWAEGPDRATTPSRVISAGLDRAVPAPGVLESIRTADVLVIAPGDPVLEVGPLIGVPGVVDALRGTSAPVVVVDPVAGSRDVPGLAVAGLPCDGPGAARVYRDVADGWVSHQAGGYPASLTVAATAATTAESLAAAALDLGLRLRQQPLRSGSADGSGDSGADRASAPPPRSPR